MTRTLSQIMEQHRSELESQWPWIWLYEIEVPTDPPTRYRLTNFLTKVPFGKNTSGATLEYYPFPIAHSSITADSGGDLTGIEINVGNVSREISQALATYDGLVGQPVVIRLVNSQDLVNAQAQLRDDSVVKGVRVTNEVVTFTLSPYNLYERMFPPFRIVAQHCRRLYGGPKCGYDLTTPGALTSCGKTLSACEAHGDAEVTAGLDRLHPKRFGAYPGVRNVR